MECADRRALLRSPLEHEFYALKKYDEALECYDKALEIDAYFAKKLVDIWKIFNQFSSLF